MKTNVQYGAPNIHENRNEMTYDHKTERTKETKLN